MSDEVRYKQVIVMRTEYPKGGIRKGKMIAQGAHASMMFLTRQMIGKTPISASPVAHLTEDPNRRYDIYLSDSQKEWIDRNFAKICLQVKTEEELDDIAEKAIRAGLEVHTCTDSGLTEFGGIPTKTCIAIGPDKAEKIDAVTGGLRLL